MVTLNRLNGSKRIVRRGLLVLPTLKNLLFIPRYETVGASFSICFTETDISD